MLHNVVLISVLFDVNHWGYFQLKNTAQLQNTCFFLITMINFLIFFPIHFFLSCMHNIFEELYILISSRRYTLTLQCWIVAVGDDSSIHI